MQNQTYRQGDREFPLLHPKAKARRDKMRAARVCINGPADPDRRVGLRGIEHGPVADGQTKCQRCLDVAKRSR